MKPNKAAGPHGLRADYFRIAPDPALKYVKIWVNKTMETQKIPQNLKWGKVKLLYKRGSNLQPTNYRPITLSPILMKILTKLLNIRERYGINSILTTKTDNKSTHSQIRH